MKNLILLIALFLAYNANAFAKVKHVKLLYSGTGVFAASRHYQVLYCQDEACRKPVEAALVERLGAQRLVMQALAKDVKHERSIRNYGHYRFRTYPTDLVDVIENLSGDYSERYGEHAWKKEDVIELMSYLRRSARVAVIYNLDVTASFKGAHGKEKNILIYDAQAGEAHVIFRQTFAQ